MRYMFKDSAYIHPKPIIFNELTDDEKKQYNERKTASLQKQVLRQHPSLEGIISDDGSLNTDHVFLQNLNTGGKRRRRTHRRTSRKRKTKKTKKKRTKKRKHTKKRHRTK